MYIGTPATVHSLYHRRCRTVVACNCDRHRNTANYHGVASLLCTTPPRAHYRQGRATHRGGCTYCTHTHTPSIVDYRPRVHRVLLSIKWFLHKTHHAYTMNLVYYLYMQANGRRFVTKTQFEQCTRFFHM